MNAAATLAANGVVLLERAMGYTMGSLALVNPAAMRDPTPCRGWDLRTLLLHMNHSLATMHEAIAHGYLGIDDFAGPDALLTDPRTDPVAALEERGALMLRAWADASDPSDVSVAGHPVSSGIVAAAGAIEVAVHGWDVSAACRADRPIPPVLADELHDLCLVLVGDGDRPLAFAPTVEVPPTAAPSDRLLGFLGRRAH
jgi:uncharacterized protein (TIGR03086 family)